MTRRRVMLSLLLVLSALLLVSRLVPRVTQIEVIGLRHLSETQVLEEADLKPGDPFLWVIRPRFASLARDPWVARVSVLRRWPDTVTLTLWERLPYFSDGENVYALDGTLLPGAAGEEALVQLSGWGPDRRAEALGLLSLLADFRPEVLSYSPSGFEVSLAHAELYTPSLDALRAHWSGFVSQHASQQASQKSSGEGERSRVAVYPWGVSVKP